MSGAPGYFAWGDGPDVALDHSEKVNEVIIADKPHGDGVPVAENRPLKDSGLF
jgi:hypothetical protein